MRNKPKRHFLVVEVTDTELGYSTKRVKQIVEDSLNRGLYYYGPGGIFANFVNLQVKDLRRVLPSLRKKNTK